MSNQSSPPLGYFTDPFVNHIHMLAARLGMGCDSLTLKDGILSLFLQSDEGTICIELAPTQDSTCWVLTRFEIPRTSEKKMLSGYKLLTHFAKRLAILPIDFVHPSDEVWTFRRAADLAALLETYDKVARDWGLEVVFGH